MRLFSKYPPATRGTIVVWGFLASHPFGGMTWQVLHHLAGLRRLGFDVWYVEDSDRYLYDPITYCKTPDHTPNVEYLSRHMNMVGLGDRWVFRAPESDAVLGALDAAGLARLYRETDVALNLCGAQESLPEHDHIRCRVFIETDPVTNQVALAEGDEQLIQELDAYDYLFTYGANFGAPDCLVPVERYNWRPTRPPVCIDWWATNGAPPPAAPLTTITNWKHGDDKDVVWRGELWRWNKDTEFLRLKHLPSRSALPLELAVGSMGDEDMEEMRRCGWRIIDASDFTEPAAYRQYIQTSRGEFTASKELVVRSRCGWFSDRSVCYLASGRPVITQDTGFGNQVPTGEGLFAFSTEDEALAAIDRVAGDYERNCAAARAIAQEFFSAERLMCDLARQVGLI